MRTHDLGWWSLQHHDALARALVRDPGTRHQRGRPVESLRLLAQSVGHIGYRRHHHIAVVTREREPTLRPPRRRAHATIARTIVLPRQFDRLQVRPARREPPHPQRPVRFHDGQIQIQTLVVARLFADAHRHVTPGRRRTQSSRQNLEDGARGQTRRWCRRRGDHRDWHRDLPIPPAAAVSPQTHRARRRGHRRPLRRLGPGVAAPVDDLRSG